MIPSFLLNLFNNIKISITSLYSMKVLIIFMLKIMIHLLNKKIKGKIDKPKFILFKEKLKKRNNLLVLIFFS